MKIEIAASLLAADFSQLGAEVKRASDSGVDRIHIDVIDGHFAPNISFGPQMVAALRKCSNLLFEIHMMVEKPENFIVEFIEAGADIIIIHSESNGELKTALGKIKELGVKTGIALKPETPISAVEGLISESDLILPMSVNPGFSGQKFIENVLDKMAQLNRLKRLVEGEEHRQIDLEADGGVNLNTAPMVVKAGANVLVSGAAIFKAQNMRKAVEELKNFV